MTAASGVEEANAWAEYLESLRERSSVRREAAAAVIAAWPDLEAEGARPPSATVNDDGYVALTWDRGPYHVGLEFGDGEDADWYGIDRRVGDCASGCWRVGWPVPDGLRAWLRRAARTVAAPGAKE